MARTALIRSLVSLLLTGGLIVWLLRSAAAGQAVQLLHALPWSLLGILLLTQSLSYACRAGRLYSQFARRLPLGPAAWLRLSLLHNLSVNILPFRSGELLLPAMLQRAGLSLGEALGTLFWLRLQDLIVLAGFALLLWPGLATPLRLGGGLVLWLGLSVADRWLRHWQPAGPRMARLLEALRHVCDASPTSWAWCLANWSCKLAGLAVLLAALGEFRQAAAAAGALGGELSALLPIQGVAGFGTYEAGVAALLDLATGHGRAALAPAFALHCLTLLIAVLAGTLAWFARPGHDAVPLPPRREIPS